MHESSGILNSSVRPSALPKAVGGLRLYQAQITPSSRKVRMFLQEKNLSVEMEDVTEGFGLSKAYVAKYPHAVVPMLELEDGTQIGEAITICRYIEGLCPEGPLFGTDTRSRAIVDMWERRAYLEGTGAVDEIFRNSHPLMVDRGLAGMTEPVPQIPALVDRGQLRLSRFFTKFDQRLAESRYVGGDVFSVADISTFCAIDFARFIGVELPGSCANLGRWFQDVSSRPSASA
jgi:glutathione S-transferase